MGIGISGLAVIAGAILLFAVDADVEGIDLDTVGIILLIVGVVGAAWSLLVASGALPPARRDQYVDER
jgi:hypothetical protein